MSDRRLAPLQALDLAQVRFAAVLAAVGDDGWSRPTPCSEWTVRDIANKIVASTSMFTSFARRDEPDPSLDLVHPRELLGDDPVATYLDAAEACRSAWRTPGALDGTAPSTQGEFPATAVLNARIFDTTVLGIDLADAVDVDHLVDEAQARYVIRVARALVPVVRGNDPARYAAPPEDPDASDDPVRQLRLIAGRDPDWRTSRPAGTPVR